MIHDSINLSSFLGISIVLSAIMLVLSLLIIIIYFVKMSDLYNRILALDALVIVGLGIICLYAIISGFYFYVDIVIAISLIAFLSTIALARYGLKQRDRSTE